MSPIIPPPAMGKIVKQTGLFSLGMANQSWRRKTLNSKLVKFYSEILLHPAQVEGLGKYLPSQTIATSHEQNQTLKFYSEN